MVFSALEKYGSDTILKAQALPTCENTRDHIHINIWISPAPDLYLSPASSPYSVCSECLDIISACVCAQLCLTLCNAMVYNLPGFSVQGIFQARILEWVAIFYFRGSSWSRDWTCVSCSPCLGSQICYHWATWEAWDQVHRAKSTLCSLTQSFESYLRHVLCHPSLVWKHMLEWFLFCLHFTGKQHREERWGHRIVCSLKNGCTQWREGEVEEDDQWHTELVNF